MEDDPTWRYPSTTSVRTPSRRFYGLDSNRWDTFQHSGWFCWKLKLMKFVVFLLRVSGNCKSALTEKMGIGLCAIICAHSLEDLSPTRVHEDVHLICHPPITTSSPRWRRSPEVAIFRAMMTRFAAVDHFLEVLEWCLQRLDLYVSQPQECLNVGDRPDWKRNAWGFLK